LAEVNMTPLIDVSLVLVVILMLATPLAFESSLGLQQAATAESVEAAAEPVSVAVLSDSEVAVNDEVISVSELAGKLKPLLAAASHPAVAVRCADTVRHGTFVQVLDIARLSGALGIAITENR